VVDPLLAPLLVALAAALLTSLAEAWHALRIRRVLHLAFGPRARPARWARSVPILRATALAALGWGAATLLLIEPRRHSSAEGTVTREGDVRHVLLVLDVSPSMRLEDAGTDRLQSRMQRAQAVMDSFLARVPLAQYRISIVAVYNGAKPVVVDTTDVEVVRNILGDLPMHYAFPAGKTRLLDGLEEAVRIAKPWNPRSTVLMLLSDGDSVPTTGMPKMPASIDDVLVVGVGDPQAGSFIDGRQSRQDVSMLRQIATRLGGVYHNGNVQHLSSALVGDLTMVEEVNPWERLTRREYALLACAAGAALLALLPLLLHFRGTAWRPGTALRANSSLPAGRT